LDKKQGLTIAAVFLLLFSAVAGLSSVIFVSGGLYVQHYSSIFIWGDGTYEPASAPIQRIDNEVYVLTNDVYGGISLEKSGVIIDGNGHRIFGNWGTGLLLKNVTNVTVRNLKILYFENGIYLENSNNTLLKNNTLFNCGITLAKNSINNYITGNNVSSIISVESGNNNTITSNIASGVSVAWSTNVTVGNNILSDAKRANATSVLGGYTEGISIDNSNDSYVFSNIIERKGLGVNIWYSSNLTFRNNILKDNQFGFKLVGNSLQTNLQNIDTSNTVDGKAVYFLINVTDYKVPNSAGWIAAINCKNITVQSWTSTPNWDGILFAYTRDSKVVSSNLKNNFNAIRFDNVSNCLVNQNTIVDNQYAALCFKNTTDCTVTQNDVLNNYCFFDIWQNSLGNTFYHNNFVGNWTGTMDKNLGSVWDNGYEGNYWSCYTGVDLDKNGIGDSPFLIDVFSGEKDNYPKLTPYGDKIKPPIQQETSFVSLAMPEEFLNYTISDINGVLWAKIDGIYPIHMINGLGQSLSLVYPTPPNTTNIHVKLNCEELRIKNYSEVDPSATHYTDIGSWSMIYSSINPASEDFLLEIHYEHPIETIKGEFTFLYDLNISPYLSTSSVNSIAHFKVVLENTSLNLNVYTTGFQDKWTQLNYNSIEEEPSTVSFDIVSEYGKPLVGDIAFVLVDKTIPELPAVIAILCLVTVTGVILSLRKTVKPKNKTTTYRKYSNVSSTAIGLHTWLPCLLGLVIPAYRVFSIHWNFVFKQRNLFQIKSPSDQNRTRFV
jgi:parallel beta-helix repeat protein